MRVSGNAPRICYEFASSVVSTGGLQARQQLASSLTRPWPLPRSFATFCVLHFAGKEERLHDYNARKANLAAKEVAFWDEELALHSVDVLEAERSVHRQRVIDWETRASPARHGAVMEAMKFPFRATSKELV